MKTYAAEDKDVQAFVEQNASYVTHLGPDDVLATIGQANTIRKNITSTWYGLLFFVIVCILVVVLMTLSVMSLWGSSIFSKVKVFMLLVIFVVVSFLFYL
jgi:hypothetical protein